MRSQMLVFLVVTAGAIAGPAAADVALERTSSTPFRATRPGEVIVPVIVGGRGPYRFLLDTGSTHTAVTAALVDAVDARPVARTGCAPLPDCSNAWSSLCRRSLSGTPWPRA